MNINYPPYTDYFAFQDGRGMNSPPPDPYRTGPDYSPRGRRDYSPRRDQMRDQFEQRRDQFEDRRDDFERRRDEFERKRDMGMLTEAERREFEEKRDRHEDRRDRFEDMRDKYEDMRDRRESYNDTRNRDYGPSYGRQSPVQYRDDLGPGSQINRRALEEKKRELSRNRVLLAEKDSRHKKWEKRWENAVKVVFDCAATESGLQGVLPYKDCINIMEDLNRVLNLNLDPRDIWTTAKRNECSKAGQVFIPSYLQLVKPNYT